MMNRGQRLNRALLTAAVASIAAGLWFSSAPAVAQGRLPRVLALEQSLRGEDENELRWPVAVAAASDEEFAVADAFRPRLVVFRKTGLAWEAGSSVSLPGTPVGLARGEDRYVVSLRGTQGLIALEGPGLLQRRIGLPAGVVPGPLASLPGGRLLVHDSAAERLIVLDPGGKVENEVQVGGGVTALATTASGKIYTAVGAEATVLRHDAQGNPAGTWRLPSDGPTPPWPSGLVVEPGGDVYVVDRHGDRILLLDVGGKPAGLGSRRGWEPGLLRYPRAIARMPGGLLLVADEGNGRVQIFRRTEGDGAR